MGAEPLAAVCELAFAVAKEGVDHTPPIEPPAAMRSYLYVARLPVRAFTVTERVLDTDAEFRARVAERATEETVGRAGYLWVHRPDGWEDELAVLAPSVTTHVKPPPMPEPPVTSSTATTASPPIPDPISVADPSTEPLGILSDDAFESPPSRPDHRVATPSPAPPAAPASPAPPAGAVPSKPTRPAPASSAPPSRLTPLSSDSVIEDELSSLRELVDRLADERKNVRNSVKDLEVEVETRRAETYEMTTHLQQMEADLAAARASEMELADELGRARARIEALEAERTELVAERDGARSSVRSLTGERDTAIGNLTQITEDRDRLEAARAALEVERNAFGTERDRLREANAELERSRDDLRGRLDVAEQARTDLERELSDVSSAKQQLQVEVNELNQQRSELIRRVAELAEERDRASDTQRDLVASLTAQLEEISEERELILVQLEATQLQLGATREALDSSHQIVVEELAKADNVIVESFASLAKIDGSMAEVARGVEEVAEIELAPIDVPIDDSPEVAVEAGSVDAGLEDTEFEDTEFEDADFEDAEFEDAEFEDAELEDTEFEDAEFEDAGADDAGAGDGGVESAESDGPVTRSTPPIPEPDDVARSAVAAAEASEDDGFAGMTVEPEPPTVDEPAFESTGFESTGFESTGFEGTGFDSTGFESTEFETTGFESPELDGSGFDSSGFDGAGFDGSAFAEADAETTSEPEPEAAGDSLEAAIADALADRGLVAEEPAPVTGTPADSGSPAVGSRVRLDVPDHLAGDDLASARYLVHGTDVVLLVDGDEAASQGWSDFPVADQRRALVQYLNQLAAQVSTASDVVFYESVSRDFPEPKAVRIRECDDSVPRADYFAGIVDGYPSEWPIVVVSDDLDVQAATTARGASTISCVQLLDVLMEFYTGG